MNRRGCSQRTVADVAIRPFSIPDREQAGERFAGLRTALHGARSAVDLTDDATWEKTDADFTVDIARNLWYSWDGDAILSSRHSGGPFTDDSEFLGKRALACIRR